MSATKSEPINLDAVFAHTEAIEARVGALEKGFDSVNSKLDKLTALISGYAAQSPWRVSDVLGISRDLLTIGAILGGTVIFIAHAITGGQVNALSRDLVNEQERSKRIERLLERTLEARVSKSNG